MVLAGCPRQMAWVAEIISPTGPAFATYRMKIISISGVGGKGEREQRLLFEFVWFGRACSGASARRALDRAKVQPKILHQLRQTGHDVKKRSHVARFFLYPHHFARVGV